MFTHVKFEEERQVDVLTLDKFCIENKIDHIDFLWSDSQGRRIRHN